MIRNNYHTHTFRCGHAVGSDEEYVLEAIGAGLFTLGFSDHIMLPNIRQSNVRGDFEASESYFDSINALKEKYKDRIDIRLGFEAEAMEQFFPYYQKLLEEGKIEYLVLGNHCYLENNMLKPFFTKYTEKKNIIAYKDTLINGMKSGLFSCVAHPDYFMDSYFKWDFTTKKVAKEIILASIEYDVPLEFNFACIRRGKQQKGKELRYGYPYEKFWKLVAKMNAKVVLGLDAHSPSDLASYLNDEGFALVNRLHLNVINELEFKDIKKVVNV